MIAALLAVAAAFAPLRCGAVERPGIAEQDSGGVWRGVAIDLCRKVAQERRGAAIAFHPYRSIADLRDARHDVLAVLSPAERALAFPAARPPIGPPVAVSRQLLLAKLGSPLRDTSQLAGQRVCFIIASAAEAALNAWARSAHVAILRVGFQEPVELRDGFDSGFCAAMAVDARDIPGGAERTATLGVPLVEVPLFAVLPTAGTR